MKFLGIYAKIFIIGNTEVKTVFGNKLIDFIKDKDNLAIIIISAAFIVLFITLMIILLVLGLKKKKYRKLLIVLRKRIQSIKQHEVIKNYATYDNLKNDQKLGMLILRWKKEVEKLVQEIDAQYSLLDVLEDAIEQNNYKYFLSLKINFEKDLDELEKKANHFKNDIIEYVDMASDNRNYINKYYEMLTELKSEYIQNSSVYKDNQDKLEDFFLEIETKFKDCNKYIELSRFNDADNLASNIFKDIKILENYIHNAPKILKRINDDMIPKFYYLNKLANQFTEEEFSNMQINFQNQFDSNMNKLKLIIKEINNFSIEDFTDELDTLDYYLNNTITRLDKEHSNKIYISDTINQQKANIEKIENTAKNFISIFKIVEGSYNITYQDINLIEQIIQNIECIKKSLNDIENRYLNKLDTYTQITEAIDALSNVIAKLSKELDDKLVIIDDIYKDEKAARDQINLLTEKINGTKKYLKYAYLDNQDHYLKIIKQLSIELSQLYVLLGTFPIDIVKLNEAVSIIKEKVEKTTQEINRQIYKVLLTEFVLMYAYRYFSNQEYQKGILSAEELFFKHDYTSAFEKIMDILDKISPKERKLVLEKYQMKFNELFY